MSVLSCLSGTRFFLFVSSKCFSSLPLTVYRGFSVPGRRVSQGARGPRSEGQAGGSSDRGKDRTEGTVWLREIV